LVFARRFAHANRLFILSRLNHNYHDAAAMGSRAARMAWIDWTVLMNVYYSRVPCRQQSGDKMPTIQ